MKNLLKETIKNKDADYIEIRIEDTSETFINFQGSMLENIGEAQKFGGNIRALVNGGWGFVTFNLLESIEDNIKRVIKNAKIADTEGYSGINLAKASFIEDTVKVSFVKDPGEVSLDKKVSLLKKYNDFMLDYNEYIKSTSVRYFERSTKLYYANSESAYIEQEKMDLGCNFMAIAVKGSDTQYGFVGKGSSNDYGVVLGLEEEIKNACENAILKLSSRKITGGEYTVIIDPMLTGTFIHEAFGHLSEGDNIFEDPRLKDIMKIGRTFCKKNLTVYDSGLDTGHRGYLKYDDEGVPTKKTYLIREGKLAGRLHSRETAGKMNEAVTGNARAINYKFPPICRMRNTCVEKGDAPFEDMIKDVKLGVYAKEAYGGQTNGELFTFTPGDAFMIKDGKIAERVRDVTLSGNLFTTLENIEMIGNDFKVHDSAGGCGKAGQSPLPVTHGGPHLRIKGVVIGGAGK